MRAGCWSPPARKSCVGRGREVMVEQIRHPVMAALLIDAAVHLADQGVPLLPPRPPLPSLPPPPLLAQPGFHAARTSLQGTNRASIPRILGLTPSLHHNDLTIIWAQGPTQPLSSMVPRLLSHGGGGRNWIPGQCGVNLVSYWSDGLSCFLIGRKLSAISSKSCRSADPVWQWLCAL